MYDISIWKKILVYQGVSSYIFIFSGNSDSVNCIDEQLNEAGRH